MTTFHESYRARRRAELADLMEGGPDKTRFAKDDGGVWHRLGEGDHVLAEISERSSKRFGIGYRLRTIADRPTDPDDEDEEANTDLLSNTDDDDETDPDNETEETTMIEKTDAERAEAARQGTMRSEPDTAIAQAVKVYIATNGGTFNDALEVVKQQDGAMWRAYARWLVHKKATNDKTRDDLADLALEYKYAAGQHLMAEILAEGSRDNSAALARETSKFLAEHDTSGVAGIDAARTYLRVKRPDLFEAEPDERS